MHTAARRSGMSTNQSITPLQQWLGVSKEILYICPLQASPSLSFLSQSCPSSEDPEGIQILSGTVSPALHWPAPATLMLNAAK